MKKECLAIMIFVITFFSCGKSNSEIELEKAKLELEKTKLELIEKDKSNEELKIHEQRYNVGKQKRLAKLNELLKKAPEMIATAETNLKKVNGFQIGRSYSEKEKQIKDAQSKLNDANKFYNNLKIEVAELEYWKTFDFQKDPISLMNYVFTSAKTHDVKNFRYLCDPYAENDDDTQNICFLELQNETQKAFLLKSLANGRIMNKPIIDTENATIEFAYGENSDKLGKINLIRRNGFWYFSNL